MKITNTPAQLVFPTDIERLTCRAFGSDFRVKVGTAPTDLQKSGLGFAADGSYYEFFNDGQTHHVWCFEGEATLEFAHEEAN